jgi:hypothetical protein
MIGIYPEIPGPSEVFKKETILPAGHDVASHPSGHDVITSRHFGCDFGRVGVWHPCKRMPPK